MAAGRSVSYNVVSMNTPRLKARPGRPRWALLMLAGVAVGCWGHPVERRLAGRWLGTGVENVDEASLPGATGWARGASFEFSGRKLTVAVPAEQPRTGRYQVLSAVDRRVALEVERPDGGTDRMDLELEAEDRARWPVGNGRVVLLERER